MQPPKCKILCFMQPRKCKMYFHSMNWTIKLLLLHAGEDLIDIDTVVSIMYVACVCRMAQVYTPVDTAATGLS